MLVFETNEKGGIQVLITLGNYILIFFVLLCWAACLIYMLARERDFALRAIELKEKWFYLVLFIVLSVILCLLFYYNFIGGNL